VEVDVVIMIFYFYAIILFLVIFFMLHDTAVYGWFYGMYTVASVLPPLLPTVFTVSVGGSDNRLAKKRIACTNSDEILVDLPLGMAVCHSLTRSGRDLIGNPVDLAMFVASEAHYEGKHEGGTIRVTDAF
jgi:magnesium-transporting ATPase (P-type)